MGSATVRFWDFHQWVRPYLDAAGDWPMAGSQPWFDLPDNHPAKWAAVLDAARHHVLRVECGQERLAEASREVASAADWRSIAAAIFARRSSGYIRRGIA
ncbi:MULTISPECIES: DUF2742 domain-containing protein [unclassified Mycobacterium]|uniref:DUF2742 domain-containing protein n=1 Tax=unclassified Mycobacterium TaxID=2642494 RepID=UPI000801FE5C|nr:MULTISPECIES: DUF2742 domain-containing protein [unclassified Mycobacterium]OBG51840.1 hypothetical protein A5704_00930 [Mycobacterium sp. E735]OBG69244.1 hypothetical protein A9X05_05265 [Mycobacterium sp. E3298]